jgi:hypothetical protein
VSNILNFQYFYKMSTPDPNEERAAQLRKPSGVEGIKTGVWMSHGNRYIIQDALKQLQAGENNSILEIGMGNVFFFRNSKAT